RLINLMDALLADQANGKVLIQAPIQFFFAVRIWRGPAPLAGNTVHQDRRFMALYMPALDAYLHYRIVDVSTLKELAKRWRPDVVETVPKEGRHEALADILESIEELRHYRKHFLRMEP
ncbi:MAG TPA: oligoribonuclease, partial [Usitatibacter sp.]|nr:oligoribonuclease [Usitatibacter sp.]